MQRISSNTDRKLNALRHCRYFYGLPESILRELAPGTRLFHYEAGESIFFEREPCAGLHIIEHGRVKLYKISPRGREMILRTLGKGESFNEVPVFDEGANPVNAAALDPSKLWVVSGEIVRNAMAAHPEMAAGIIVNLSQNLRMMLGKVEEIAFFHVTNRLARLIYHLPKSQLQGSSPERLTQDELAARLGTVREVVARSLKELECNGAIRVSRRQIQIVDEDMLKEWAHLFD